MKKVDWFRLSPDGKKGLQIKVPKFSWGNANRFRLKINKYMYIHMYIKSSL